MAEGKEKPPCPRVAERGRSDFINKVRRLVVFKQFRNFFVGLDIRRTVTGRRFLFFLNFRVSSEAKEAGSDFDPGGTGRASHEAGL